MTRLVIELTGSATATCGRYSVTHSKSDPICRLARKMIKAGIPPETEVVVRRGSVVCFEKPTTVGGWARLAISEGEKTCLGIRWYRAPDFAADDAHAQEETAIAEAAE